jgi:protein tyrosine/serine phosphatase
MGRLGRGILIAGIVVIVGVAPLVLYRYTYTRNKRLREVVPGQVYRSGQMTAPGFADAVRNYGIRTIINVQDDFPDPDISEGYFTRKTIKETELCRQLGVRYVHLAPDLLARNGTDQRRPQAIEEFLARMDDPATYPVLIHCKAGLHRTGVMLAIYRMEYDGWGPAAALRELKAHGFGETTSNAANDYITQYVLKYRPGLRQLDAAQQGVLVPRELLPPRSFLAPHTPRP